MTDDEVDEFAIPVTLGMRPVVEPHDVLADAELRARLDTYDAMRCRGAVEARTAGPIR